MTHAKWRNINGAQYKFDFDLGPFWLNFLALIPIFDTYAYPIAIKKGLATVYVPENISELQILTNQGWKIEIGDLSEGERFRIGSSATLTSGSSARLNRRRRAVRLGGVRKLLVEPLRIFAWSKWSRTLISRRYVHKFNGSYGEYRASCREAKAKLKLSNDH